LAAYLGIVTVEVFSLVDEPGLKSFHIQANGDDDCGTVIGNESGANASPEILSKGK
jgi:hypothetical protein